MTIRADLHIHSCLSPCGELTMSPRTIVSTAVREGLHLIALTDHNTTRNIPAFAAACAREHLPALYGCEVTSVEEVHVLALFAEPQTAIRFGDEVYASLPHDRRDPERFGDQVVVDEEETIVETLDSYLIAATPFPLDEIGRRIHAAGGLYIPAHIDRSAFSVWSQLGFLPADDYDAVEITGADGRIEAGTYPRICSSDAHQPEAIGRRWIEYEGAAPRFETLVTAMRERRIAASIHQ